MFILTLAPPYTQWSIWFSFSQKPLLVYILLWHGHKELCLHLDLTTSYKKVYHLCKQLPLSQLLSVQCIGRIWISEVLRKLQAQWKNRLLSVWFIHLHAGSYCLHWWINCFSSPNTCRSRWGTHKVNSSQGKGVNEKEEKCENLSLIVLIPSCNDEHGLRPKA